MPHMQKETKTKHFTAFGPYLFFSVRNKNKSLFKNGLNSLKLDLVARERKREDPGALHGLTLIPTYFDTIG